MDWTKVRKALVAAVGAFISAEATAAITAGGWPGWAETGAAVGLGVAAGFAVWRVPNAKAVAPVVVAPVKPAV